MKHNSRGSLQWQLGNHTLLLDTHTQRHTHRHTHTRLLLMFLFTRVALIRSPGAFWGSVGGSDELCFGPFHYTSSPRHVCDDLLAEAQPTGAAAAAVAFTDTSTSSDFLLPHKNSWCDDCTAFSTKISVLTRIFFFLSFFLFFFFLKV